ncbi:hypothetical protein GCM10023201_11880 [Actinomycetospora corticicola]|uniref:Uncharacterized protein n=1 Tax=Actinomycetospora corticicola TaxID=663602 RepID=A0A7Y9J8T9_9PSEU|nr:hypothetical protein [Actinomycetospora corticicola]NYD38799.1 hypothetical protein [Actinomycetospora corticicola]
MASKPAGKQKPLPKPPKGATTPPQPRTASSTRPSPAKPTSTTAAPAARPAQVDVGAIARGISSGFMILVFGGLIQPVVTAFVPVVGMFWLILVAVTAFAFAGYRVGLACPNPPLHGAGAAVGSYLLVVPLMFLQGTFDPLYTVFSFVAAAVVGGAAGRIAGRSRSTAS